MRGSRTIAVLDFIERFTSSTAKLIDALANSSKSNYLALKNLSNTYPWRNKKQAKNDGIWHVLLHKLRKEGLIDRVGERGTGRWHITESGRTELARLKERTLPYPKKYKKEKGDALIIVSFDIPEKERRKEIGLELF